MQNLFWCCSSGDNISVSLFVMKLLSSLIQIPLRILLANMKKSLWSFGGREPSLNNLEPGIKGSSKKSVCVSGCLLMTTEGLLLLVFCEVSAFLFLCVTVLITDGYLVIINLFGSINC